MFLDQSTRLAIVGPTGAGKSTLARQVADRCAIEYVDADRIFHESTPDTAARQLSQALAADCWVSDGNIGRFRALQLPRIATLIWLDYPLRITLPRLLRRTLRRVFTGELVHGLFRETYDTVIWDFNGTLLDDVALAVRSVNAVIRRLNLPSIDADRHRQTFGHPVADYYRALGINLAEEDLSLLSDEFHAGYLSGVRQCTMVKGAKDLLHAFQDRGLRQFVLSAAEQGMLESWVSMLGLAEVFEGVFGLADRLAVTKVERGRELIAAHRIQPGTTLLIGDTDHDVETASALGCRAALVAQGHQSRERLAETGASVFDTFHELCDALQTRPDAGQTTRLLSDE